MRGEGGEFGPEIPQLRRREEPLLHVADLQQPEADALQVADLQAQRPCAGTEHREPTKSSAEHHRPRAPLAGPEFHLGVNIKYVDRILNNVTQ